MTENMKQYHISYTAMPRINGGEFALRSNSIASRQLNWI